MGLDRRIRDAFEQDARSIEPDVEARLAAVEQAARRHRSAPIGSLLVATLAIAAILLIPPAFRGTGSGPSPSAVPSASLPATAAIAGTYAATLDTVDVGVPGLDVAGEWSMTLGLDGVIDLVPPPAFTGSRAEGHSFALDGSTFRTDLYRNDYCATLGVYTWERTGSGLRLTSVDDTCAIRRVILGTAAWMAAP